MSRHWGSSQALLTPRDMPISWVDSHGGERPPQAGLMRLQIQTPDTFWLPALWCEDCKVQPRRWWPGSPLGSSPIPVVEARKAVLGFSVLAEAGSMGG